MSFAGYFFGNVDEQGRLESDLDDELKETLSTVDAGVISKIFSGNPFGLENAGKEEDDDEEEEEDEDQPIPTRLPPTAHSSDAVDYSDFNEAVPDDPMFSDKYFKRGMGLVQKSLPRSRLSLVTDNYDDEDEDMEPSPPPPPPFPGCIMKRCSTEESEIPSKLFCDFCNKKRSLQNHIVHPHEKDSHPKSLLN
ncbi:hypothetical protein G6F56_000458 [Rhizopus delemar]|nr:hypothetical protein G6F56_000458 [Rhizopus delemar]